MKTEVILKAIDILLAAGDLLETAGVNYREVQDAKDRAKAEGRELDATERQVFIDQAQAALDRL